MTFSVETIGKLFASGRNLVSTFVGLFNGIGLIFSGATSLWQILVVVFPIIGVLMAKLASNSARTDSQAQAVTAAIKDPNSPVSIETKAAVLESAVSLPEVPKIEVTDPVLAQVVPSPQVVPVAP